MNGNETFGQTLQQAGTVGRRVHERPKIRDGRLTRQRARAECSSQDHLREIRWIAAGEVHDICGIDTRISLFLSVLADYL